MKNVILASAAFAGIISGSVFAQVTLSPGFTGGVSISKEKLKSSGLTIEGDNVTGLTVGGVLDIGMTQNFSVEPGLIFTQRGTKISMDFGGTSVTATHSLNYLEIPVVAKGKLPLGTVTPYALAGVSLGILLSANTTAEATGMPSTDEEDTSTTATDFGLNFGGGAELAMGNVKPYVEFSYYLGLLNIAKDASSDESEKSQGMAIRAGLKFDIKK